MDKNRAGQAFREIARRLKGEDVPFRPLEDPRNFFQKLAARIAKV